MLESTLRIPANVHPVQTATAVSDTLNLQTPKAAPHLQPVATPPIQSINQGMPRWNDSGTNPTIVYDPITGRSTLVSKQMMGAALGSWKTKLCSFVVRRRRWLRFTKLPSQLKPFAQTTFAYLGLCAVHSPPPWICGRWPVGGVLCRSHCLPSHVCPIWLMEKKRLLAVCFGLQVLQLLFTGISHWLGGLPYKSSWKISWCHSP